MVQNELTHHGTKGQRWGVRRFQNKDGSLTPAGKKRYGIGEAIKQRQTVAKRNKNLKKARAAAAAKREEKKTLEEAKKTREEEKQKAIASGSATDVLKFKGELTQQEMQYVSSRIRWEQEMSSLSSKELNAGKKTADDFFNGLEKATGYVNTGLRAYNTAANIYNAFSGKGKLLPKVDTNITNGNRDQYLKEKAERKKAVDAQNKRKQQEAQREKKQKERAAKRAAEEKQRAAEEKKRTQAEQQSKEDDVLRGKVFGTGNSHNNTSSSSSAKSSSYYDPIDTFFKEDKPASSYSNTQQAQIGQSYVELFLLEDKSR